MLFSSYDLRTALRANSSTTSMWRPEAGWWIFTAGNSRSNIKGSSASTGRSVRLRHLRRPTWARSGREQAGPRLPSKDQFQRHLAPVSRKGVYSHLPNEKGGVVDDVIVSCLAEDRFLIVVNAATSTRTSGGCPSTPKAWPLN